MLVAALGSAAAARNGIDFPGSEYLWIALGGTVLAALPPLFAPRLVFMALAPLKRLGNAWVDERVHQLSDLLSRLNDRPGGDRPGVRRRDCRAVDPGGVLHRGRPRPGDPADVRSALLVVPVSLVVQMVPLSINGFGVREAVFTYFFNKLGLSVDAALALSLISTATIAVFSLSGGLVFLLRRGGYRPRHFLPIVLNKPSLSRARGVRFRVRNPDFKVVVRSALRRLHVRETRCPGWR